MKIEKLKAYDEYGKPIVSAVFWSRCSIVRLSIESLRTSVRTDTSGTGGNAHEKVSDTRLLVNINAPLEIGDRITVQNTRLRVDQIFARNDVHGKPHHWQVDCSIDSAK